MSRAGWDARPRVPWRACLAGGVLGFQKSDADSMHALMEGKINDALKKTFNPEFLNRVDDAIIFHALDRDHIAAIIDIRLEEFKARLELQEIQVRVTPGAKNLIADKGFDQTYGARYLERAIQKMLENRLTTFVRIDFRWHGARCFPTSGSAIRSISSLYASASWSG